MERASDIRVAHLVPAPFDPDDGIIGGAERYSFELARHMADHVPTELISFGPRERSATVGNLRVRVLRAHYVRGQRTNPVSTELWRALGDATVVHCHQQHVLATSVAAFCTRLRRRRVFVTDLGGGGLDVSTYVSTDRWFHGHLHISEYSRRISNHDGKPWARVILGGVDTTKFSPDQSVSRSNRALFVGRLLPHKGIADLIEALPGGLPLDIVGPVNATGAVESMKAQAAGKAIVFHHEVGDAALVEQYRRALCLVLPSVYRTPDGQHTNVPELLGQTLLEAMACATPAICTRVASMPEIVEDGVSGFIVEPGDHGTLRSRMEWLAAHPAEASRMGAAGRERVLARFQWPAVVERCLDAYESA
jgi:glycosyltransferase involved in cell wall biosynthesis